MREMEYLVTGTEMRAYDTYTIEKIGIPAMVLMERAALAVRERVMERLLQNENDKDSVVLCVCGTGNNGGDGLCLARLLADEGVRVRVVLIGNRARLTPESAAQYAILQAYGISVEEQIPKDAFAVAVDALLGTGLSREVTGGYREAVESLNRMEAYKVAVDIPSGVNADDGKIMGTAVRAQETVCLGFLKRGVYRYPGAAYAGRVTLAQIGITGRSMAAGRPGMYTRFGSPKGLLPERRPDGNKGTFGKLLLAAGSENMAGAAILAAESAYRTGAGMVRLVVPEKIRTIIQSRIPEAILQVYESGSGLSDEERADFEKNMEWADAVAVGPGLSMGESGRELLAMALSAGRSLVIDADGLNLLAGSKQMQTLLQKRRTEERETILTPHMGELARLLGRSVKEVTDAEVECTKEAADRFQCVVVGKSARTCVSFPGHADFLNTAGNDRMATAGSGDLLTGMIASLLTQGMSPFAAAEGGVYLHACAGDRAAKTSDFPGILSSDIIKLCEVNER